MQFPFIFVFFTGEERQQLQQSVRHVRIPNAFLEENVRTIRAATLGMPTNIKLLTDLYHLDHLGP